MMLFHATRSRIHWVVIDRVVSSLLGSWTTPLAAPSTSHSHLVANRRCSGATLNKILPWTTDHGEYSSFTRAQQTQHEPVQVVVTALLFSLFSCGSGTPVVLVRTHPQVGFVLEGLV